MEIGIFFGDWKMFEVKEELKIECENFFAWDFTKIILLKWEKFHEEKEKNSFYKILIQL